MAKKKTQPWKRTVTISSVVIEAEGDAAAVSAAMQAAAGLLRGLIAGPATPALPARSDTRSGTSPGEARS